MKNLVFGFDDFLKLFDFQKCSFEEFSDRISILDISDTTGAFVVRSDLDTFLKRVCKKPADTRLKNLNQYKRNLYQMLVLEPEVGLANWFERYGSIKQPVDFYINMPAGSCIKGDTFSGMSNSKFGRICKNINFESFYNTRKLYDNDSEYIFGLLKVMYERFHLRNSMAGPAFYDHILQMDYQKIWLDFLIGANKASVFNPYTYRSILQEVFTGETLFAPVMGWNSYQTAFYTSDFEHFVSTDVIPSVVDNGHLLQTEYERIHQSNHHNQLFDIPAKTVDLYLCASEQLDQRHQFVEKYRDKVDAVLFSPPYFDLEIYDSADQSLTSFPDYQQWLQGYWAETVKLCVQVMRPGAKFGFVISNYRNHEKQEVNISADMKAVADQYLTFCQHYKVRWGGISSSRQAHKQRDGNYEDLWVFVK